MSTVEFRLGSTLLVVARLGPEVVGLNVCQVMEDGSAVTLLCMTAARSECAVGVGFAPWGEGQPTMRIGPAVLPLASEVEAAQAEAVIRVGWLQ